MFPKRTFYIIGGSFFLVSLLIFSFSIAGLTGRVISDSFANTSSHFLSLWFFISGLFMAAFPGLN